MKVTIDRPALAEAMTWVTRVIAKRPTSAALGGVRISAAEDRLTLEAFDYETSHRATLDAEVDEPGEVLVPGLFLRDAVAGGRGKQVTLTLDGDLRITSGRSSYAARTLALEDYPTLPDFPDEVGSIAVDSLAYALAVVDAAADDASPHESLRGLRIVAEGHDLQLVAIDGKRLHSYALSWEGKPFAETVPVKTLAAAVKGMRGTVMLGAGSTLGLDDGTRRVTTRCFGTEFADWTRVAAQGDLATDHFTVDVEELQAAIKAVAAVADDERPIVLDYDGTDLTVTTVEQDSGSGSEVVATEGEGAPIRMGLNPRWIADLLAARPAGPVEIAYSEPTKPIVLRDPDPDRRRGHLIAMPTRLL